jgi:hypothetical protein
MKDEGAPDRNDENAHGSIEGYARLEKRRKSRKQEVTFGYTYIPSPPVIRVLELVENVRSVAGMVHRT